MNKKEALSALIKNLEEYLHQGFRFHYAFMEEFKNLLYGAQGHEKEIFALLVKQLAFEKTLAAFYERAGKRISDYTQWKKILDKRYSQM